MDRSENNLIKKIVLSRVEEVLNLPEHTDKIGEYLNGDPYPHVIIDNFLKPDFLLGIEKEVCKTISNFKTVFKDDLQKNKSISTGDEVPELIRALSYQFGSSQFLHYLEKISGVKPLLADPHYNTEFGYYHIVSPGGILGSHLDHSQHHVFKLPHVLNLVLYLSKDWDPTYGGALCLYDESGKKLVKRIDCLYNRAVLFACNTRSYHGVEPISKNSPNQRHSLYFAYYSIRKENLDIGKSTGINSSKISSGLSLENTDPSVNYSTHFIVPFWSLLKVRNWCHLRPRIISVMQDILPPIFFRLLQSIKAKI